jgi:hypothetical protein
MVSAGENDQANTLLILPAAFNTSFISFCITESCVSQLTSIWSLIPFLLWFSGMRVVEYASEFRTDTDQVL